MSFNLDDYTNPEAVAKAVIEYAQAKRVIKYGVGETDETLARKDKAEDSLLMIAGFLEKQRNPLHRTTPYRGGTWRCWVCNQCKIVSYHGLSYCPKCGRVLDFIRAPSEELVRRYPSDTKDSGWTPYEAMPESMGFDQPWVVRKTNLSSSKSTGDD